MATIPMRLQNEPYLAIKSWQKTIEVRINDPKRQWLKIGDIIVFTNITNNEKYEKTISELLYYKDFESIIKDFWDELTHGMKQEEYLTLIHNLYSPEEIQRYGTVGIRLQ